MVLGCRWPSTRIPPHPSIPNFGEVERAGTPRIGGVNGAPPICGAAGMRLEHPWGS